MCCNTAQQQVEMIDSLFHLTRSRCFFPVHYAGEVKHINIMHVSSSNMQEYNDLLNVDIAIYVSTILDTLTVFMLNKGQGFQTQINLT